MAASDRTELIERFIGAYNAFDIDAMVALLSPDVHFENYSGGQLTASTDGIDDFRSLAEQSTSMFSEREQRILGIQFEGDVAVVAIDYRARLAVDVPDGPPAGTVIEMRGSSEYAFAEGRISRIVDRS